ncbi:probable F-box protein At4g22030 [Eucalyptus grandis]|uniref:probable F-box protein At4g22030 n=1 Tax=Eucalyptus grandis TaxID=71139 RepID=UPI00192ED43F|nr:probable F-box protein At4g22030 [Eucalyptus grandis]
MASLASTLSLSSCNPRSSKRINAAIRFPWPQKLRPAVPNPTKITLETADRLKTPVVTSVEANDVGDEIVSNEAVHGPCKSSASAYADHPSFARIQLHALLASISDRIEMHNNMCEQRNNWNHLLLSSINMITLTATTISGLSVIISASGGPLTSSSSSALLAMKLCSALLFSAATGMLLVVNKIQPSQLAEEQRNSVRLFKQLYSEVESRLDVRGDSVTEADVEEIVEKILALDKAYPLSLIGKMLEKFPGKFEPAIWWPMSSDGDDNQEKERDSSCEERENIDDFLKNVEQIDNGWSEELEVEMRAVLHVLKSKDSEDYMRLGNLVLKINKALAISGPLLTGIAAFGSVFMGPTGGPWAAVAAVTGGALAAVVNSFEHGYQVGMVVEMYRNCAGFFRLLEESIESTLVEREVQRRENGEMFRLKVALKLGRSLSQLRDLARKSTSSGDYGTDVDEFASKLF